jgi:hypothetical protein
MLLVALSLPIAEGTLELRGASAWIAIAGLLTILGGAMAVVGAIKNNGEQTDLILGDKETFCQLTVYADAAAGWYVSTYHSGPGGAIYDVQILVQEIREDGTPVYSRTRHVLGTITSNTWPWFLQSLNVPAILTDGRIVDTTPRYFAAQVTQRNGTSLQDIVVYPKADGTVEIGFLRLIFNGIARQPVHRLLPPGAKGVLIPEAERARIAKLRGQA